MTVFGQAVLFDRAEGEDTASPKTPMQWHRILTEPFREVPASYDVFTVSNNLEMMFSTVWPAASAR